MENENNLYLLEEYGQEMGLHGALTLKSLIDSHRNLRTLQMRDNEERLSEMQRGFDAGFKQAQEMVTKYHYLSREALRGMTLAELSSILYED